MSVQVKLKHNGTDITTLDAANSLKILKTANKLVPDDISVELTGYPLGVKVITTNGNHDVTDYATATVNVEAQPDLQDKTVNIVANGTSSITADSGYDGLGTVSLNVNVPNPSTGKINITTMNEVDVTSYAAALVVDANLVAENIKSGVTALGIAGTFTSDSNATDADIVFGKTAYAGGVLRTGTIVSYNLEHREVSTIAVTTAPTKVSYNVGENLDLTGIVVTATYTDSTTADVTSSCTFNPVNGSTLSTAGNININISYGGKTCTQAITVAAGNMPLCFTANTAGSTVAFESSEEPVLQISTDNSTWSDYTVGTTITLTNVGDKVYFKGTNDCLYDYDASKFVMTGSIAASGNVNFLLDPTGELVDLTGKDYCFQQLFYDCAALTSCPSLPATTLSEGCYTLMFGSCTNLETIPALPATTLTDMCYYSMFLNCSKIKLSATQTGEYVNAYRFPTEGTGTEGTDSTFSMFGNTGGTLDDVTVNTTYYTSNTIV